MNRKIWLLSMFILLTYWSSDAQIIHAILVINTENSIEGFAKIGQADSVLIKKELKKMAKGAKYKHQFYEATAASFNQAKVEELISTVHPTEKDVVFFYFSGASFCDEGAVNRHENRMLRLGSDGTENCNTERLFSMIEAKKAHLNIFMIDGCSVERQAKSLGGKKAVAANGVYVSLLSACGTVKLFSSKCTEYSYGDKNGSYFTNAFILGLDHFINLGSQQLTWEKLMNWTSDETAKSAMKNFRAQQPKGFFGKLEEDCQF